MKMTEEDINELIRSFPELDWMKRSDWVSVGEFADWGSWVADYSWQNPGTLPMRRLLKLRRNRRKVRQDCQLYFGEVNVPDTEDPK